MKKRCFIVSLLFIFCSAASAQLRTDSSTTTHKSLTDTATQFSLRILPSNHYSSNVGFFCKKELQLQNAIKIPIRFRLGSVAYCDAMEGKNNMHP